MLVCPLTGTILVRVLPPGSPALSFLRVLANLIHKTCYFCSFVCIQLTDTEFKSVLDLGLKNIFMSFIVSFFLFSLSICFHSSPSVVKKKKGKELLASQINILKWLRRIDGQSESPACPQGPCLAAEMTAF